MGPTSLSDARAKIIIPAPGGNGSRSSNLKSVTLLTVLSLKYEYIRGAFDKSVDWRQCAAVMQREAATVMPSCNDGVT